MFGFEGTFLDSSMVEHAAVNRGVVGSSPTRGVHATHLRSRCAAQSIKESSHASRGSLLDTWPGGQEVKTSPFHGGNTGSIPVGVTSFTFFCADVAQFMTNEE